MSKLCLWSVLFLSTIEFNCLVFAQADLGAQEETPVLAEPLRPVATRDRRAHADYLVLGNYSYFDMIVPGKYGFSVGLVRDADKTWEFEYLKGSLSVPLVIDDLAAVTDERFSLIGRSYFGGNSFNLSYGISYFAFSAHLGSQFLDRVPGGGPTRSVDVIEINSWGSNLAIGNRWTFDKNITLSVDWISWEQPLFVTKKQASFLDYATNSADRDAVKKGVTLISYLPRFTFLKLQLGILF